MTDTTYVFQTTVITTPWVQLVNDAVYRGVDPNYQTLGGVANAYTFAFPLGSLVTSLAAGTVLKVNVNATNTGASTLVVTGNVALPSVPIVSKGDALTGGELLAGTIVEMVFDGTSMQLIGSASRFAPTETPSGALNGSNVTFTLAQTPQNGYFSLYSNGLLLHAGAGNDYTISGNTITMLTAPLSTDVLLAPPYQY